MNLRALLPTVLAALTVVAHGLPTAQAQDAPQQAYIKITNDSSWTLDCRVTWGNINLTFNDIAPRASSGAKGMPVSGSERTAICKKRGVVPTKSTTSTPIKFHVTSAERFVLKCAHPAGDSAKLGCEIGKEETSTPTPAPAPAPRVAR